MKLSRFITFVFLLFLAVNTFGQTPTGYNPFVPANLDDTTKLIETPVVESSFHRYWIYGDPNYTDTSTYVWYVENGAFGVYDTLNGSWAPMIVQTLGKGLYLELPGVKVDTVRNASEIWVRWNDNMGGDSTGYVAVYERSSYDCIVENQISGFKHDIALPPEVWLTAGKMEECADQLYSVTIAFNNINDYSFPYKLKYTYPGSDGTFLTDTLTLYSRAELDASLSYTFDLVAVHDINVTRDEDYKVTLNTLRDKYGSWGVIAPEGAPYQFKELTITIFHLPQTGDMTMDSP
jgi:hypothetical protein